MYKIYVDNELFCDSSINELAVMNPVVTLEANTAGQFTFTIPVTHPYYDSITRLTSIIEVYRENKLVFRGFCSGDEKDLWNNRAITCEGDLSYLNDSILRPHKWQGETVLSLLTAYIDGVGSFKGHNKQVEVRKQFDMGVVTVSDPNDYISCFTNMNNTLTEIKEDLIDDLGGYLRVRRNNGVNYIDYIREEDFPIAPQIIELGVNLINYKSNIDDIDLATRVVPLGAIKEEQEIEGLDTRITIESVNSGLDYLESQTAVSNFGIITKTVTFDDVHAPSILKTKGQVWLNQNQFENLVIEVSAVDLGLIDIHVDTWEMLQMIRVKSAVHGLDSYFPLTKMVLNLSNPENDTFTLGTKIKNQSLVAKTIEASETSRKIADEVNPTVWLNQAKQNALNMLLSETQGGYVAFEYETNSLGQQVYIKAINVCDAPSIDESLKRWRWSQNGLGYMERDSLDIEWDDSRVRLRSAMTADGKITADAILTGTLRSRKIANGGTTMSNAPFVVDENGAVTASDIQITGGGINIDNNFIVYNDGEVHATDMHITGGDIALTSSSSSFSAITVSGKGSVANLSISISPYAIYIYNSSGKSHLDMSASAIDLYDLYDQLHMSNDELYYYFANDNHINMNGNGITLSYKYSERKITANYTQIKLERSSSSYSNTITDANIVITSPSSHKQAELGANRLYIDDTQDSNKYTHISSTSISTTGTKPRIVKTQNYDERLLYAYETPKPTFADEGHGKLDENGVCYIYMDSVFLETIDQTHKYRVFLTKYGQGDIWVEEVDKLYFVVNGTPDLEFDWKIDCVQRDYNYTNMERFSRKDIEEEEKEDLDYNDLADQYLKEYEREVIEA